MVPTTSTYAEPTQYCDGFVVSGFVPFVVKKLRSRAELASGTGRTHRYASLMSTGLNAEPIATDSGGWDARSVLDIWAAWLTLDEWSLLYPAK